MDIQFPRNKFLITLIFNCISNCTVYRQVKLFIRDILADYAQHQLNIPDRHDVRELVSVDNDRQRLALLNVQFLAHIWFGCVHYVHRILLTNSGRQTRALLCQQKFPILSNDQLFESAWTVLAADLGLSDTRANIVAQFGERTYAESALS